MPDDQESKKISDVMPGQTIQPSSSQPEPAPQAAPAPQPAPVADVNPSNIPKFGELQAKVDEHPLFSGAKEPPAPRKSLLKKTLWPVLALFVALILLYLAVDAGLVKGYSHLPFHFFKAPVAKTAPVITPAKTAPTNTSLVAPLASIVLKYEKLGLRYDSKYWSAESTSSDTQMCGKQDFLSLTHGSFNLNLAMGGFCGKGGGICFSEKGSGCTRESMELTQIQVSSTKKAYALASRTTTNFGKTWSYELVVTDTSSCTDALCFYQAVNVTQAPSTVEGTYSNGTSASTLAEYASLPEVKAALTVLETAHY